MSKVIVDANDPKDGEAFSSGGIGDKRGKLVSQYTNPMPYTEPKAQVVYIDRTSKSFAEQHPWINLAATVAATEAINVARPYARQVFDDICANLYEIWDSWNQTHKAERNETKEKPKKPESRNNANTIPFPNTRQCG